MKTFKKMAAQGDVLFIKIDSIPATAKLAKPVNGHWVVTHSETGHDHVIDLPKAEIYEAADDEFIGYIKTLGDGAEIKHLRSHDTHETIGLEPNSFYEIRRQREYTPQGFRVAAD